MASLTNENAHLKTELGAFDDAFWEELETLKWTLHKYQSRYGALE